MQNASQPPTIIHIKPTDRTLDTIGRTALMIVASLLLFVTANEQSLWLDEVETVSYSDPRVGFAYEPNNAQMPLLYVLVFVSRVLFGSHDVAYRLPVLLLSLLMLQLIPVALKREGVDSTTAWIAPYLLLLMPQFIYYAQEVRAWMPMAVCVVVWGVYRNLSGFKGWLLTTIALQSNTFAVFYVSTVVCIDWVYALWKKSERPPLAPVIGILTHIPSLLFLMYRLGDSRFPVARQSTIDIPGILFRLFNPMPTIKYIKTSFFYFFDGPQTVWILIALFSVFCLLWKTSKFKRFWIGILIALFANAHFIQITGAFAAPRYLILMLPAICIAPFLFLWKKRVVSVLVALTIIFTAHLTPKTLSLSEIKSKGDRSNISRPWQGIIPLLFSRTSTALIHTKRSDWKHLTLLLKALVKENERVLFKTCKGCWVYPLMFYDRTFDQYIDVRRVRDDTECAPWLVSTEPLPSEKTCGLSLISRLDRFFVYGQRQIILQGPIDYSRHLQN